jgi:hypothetical protein
MLLAALGAPGAIQVQSTVMVLSLLLVNALKSLCQIRVLSVYTSSLQHRSTPVRISNLHEANFIRHYMKRFVTREAERGKFK